MATNLFNGSTDLGPTREMMAAYAHFGELSPDETYDALHGSLHAVLAGDDRVHPDDLRRLNGQIGRFRLAFGPDLSDHEVWILDQLASASQTAAPASP